MISAGILLGLILLSLVLMLVPLRLRVRLSADVKRIDVRFWKMTLLDTEKSKSREEPGKHRGYEKREEDESGEGQTEREFGFLSRDWQRVRRIITLAPKLIKVALVYCARVASKLRFNGIRGSIGGGLTDPAETGVAFGFLYALSGAAPRLGEKLRMEPDYLAERIEYDLRGEVSLRPISLLWPTIKLITELPKRELIEIIRDSRRRRRKVAKQAG